MKSNLSNQAYRNYLQSLDEEVNKQFQLFDKQITRITHEFSDGTFQKAKNTSAMKEKKHYFLDLLGSLGIKNVCL